MFLFSFSAPAFSRGTQKASGACSPGQGLLLFVGEPRNFALSLCFLGGPQTRRAAKPKQEPAVPPARRHLSHSPCPREGGRLKRRMGERYQSRTMREKSDRGRRPFNKAKTGSKKRVLLHRVGSRSLILGPPSAFFWRTFSRHSGASPTMQVAGVFRRYSLCRLGGGRRFARQRMPVQSGRFRK